ncbi:MAG: hypothetical protein HYY00_02650 [Chloroflexi bacterium]|nr:hypothetical protein [Chloroflexota bacterium]
MSIWRKGWLLALLGQTAAAVSIWWWPGFDPPPISETKPHTLYFLAATAQSLAAILALVFTISLVVAQLSSRYSHRMLAEFFDPLTIGYFLVFVAAALMPLWLLGQEQPLLWATRVSLTIAAAVLLLLVPYFLRFRERLDPASVIKRLQGKAIKRLKVDREKEPEEVAAIDNFCMSAFALRDYDTFNMGVRTLGTIALEASQDMRDTVGKGVFYRLMYIGLATIDDPIAPVRVIVVLRDTGLQAVAHGQEAAEGWGTFPIANIGARAAEKGLEAPAEQAVTSLIEVGREAVEHGLSVAVRVVAGLCNIAKAVIHQDARAMDRVAEGAVETLGILTAKAIEKGMKDEDTQRMVWELDWVCRKASEGRIIDVLHAAVRRLWVIGAWATQAGASETIEGAWIALRGPEEAGILPSFLQPDYVAANESLSTDELQQALIEFRERYSGRHGGGS